MIEKKIQQNHNFSLYSIPLSRRVSDPHFFLRIRIRIRIRAKIFMRIRIRIRILGVSGGYPGEGVGVKGKNDFF